MKEMLLFWLILAVGLVIYFAGVILRGVFHKMKTGKYLAIIGSMCIGIGLPIAISEVSIPDEDAIEYEQFIIWQQIKECNENTDFDILHELYHRCEEFDRIPEKHLRLCHSRWRGRGYTENIGTLPSLRELFLEKFNNKKDDKDKMVL